MAQVAAVAWVPSLAGEFPHDLSMAKKKQKKKSKNTLKGHSPEWQQELGRFIFLNRVYFLEQFYTNSNIEQKVRKFPVCPSLHLPTTCPPTSIPTRGYVRYSGWSYTDRSLSPRVHSWHPGSLLGLCSPWLLTNVWWHEPTIRVSYRVFSLPWKSPVSARSRE